MKGTSSLEWTFVNKKDYGHLQIRMNYTDGKVALIGYSKYTIEKHYRLN